MASGTLSPPSGSPPASVSIACSLLALGTPNPGSWASFPLYPHCPGGVRHACNRVCLFRADGCYRASLASLTPELQRLRASPSGGLGTFQNGAPDPLHPAPPPQVSPPPLSGLAVNLVVATFEVYPESDYLSALPVLPLTGQATLTSHLV